MTFIIIWSILSLFCFCSYLFALLQSSKRTPSVIQMYICDLEITPVVCTPTMTINVISASNKCRCLISTLIQLQHRNYINIIKVENRSRSEYPLSTVKIKHFSLFGFVLTIIFFATIIYLLLIMLSLIFKVCLWNFQANLLHWQYWCCEVELTFVLTDGKLSQDKN